MKTNFLCSFCARCLAVGSWYEGHWVCFNCRHLVYKKPPKEAEDALRSLVKRKVVTIEEIACGGKL